MEFKELHLEQSSEAWLEWRSNGIGASDASVIMGENKFETRAMLLCSKINKLSSKPNDKMIEGTQLEPDARRAYNERLNSDLQPLCVESVEYPWLRASLDGISEKRDLIVEIKCGKSAMRSAQKRVIPIYYKGQIQHQLMVTGIEKIDYWCYRPELGGVLLQAVRDEDYISRLFDAEKSFYNEMIDAKIVKDRS